MADVRYLVEAILDVKAKGGRQAKLLAKQVDRLGASIRTTGPSVTGALFNMRTGLIALGAAAGIGKLIAGAVEANKIIEDMNLSIATTLQLFDKNRKIFDGKGKLLGVRSDTEMMATNLKEAAYATDQLFRIATTSPATFEQTVKLFDNMLPGLVRVENSMDNILEFTRKTLGLGPLLKGDYGQLGRDMRRIMTGQAGMEVRTWQEGLEAPIKALADANKKRYKLDTGNHDKFVRDFNKMDPSKRYEMIQSVMERIGAATEAASKTFTGLSSAFKSEMFLLSKAFGKSLFESLKERMASTFGRHGILDPSGETFMKLETAAKVAGTWIGDYGVWMFDQIIRGVTYFADNWERVYTELNRVFDKGLKMAKLLVSLRAGQLVAQNVVGLPLQAVGKIGNFMSALGTMMPLLTAMGISLGALFNPVTLAAAVAVMAVLGAAIAGLGVAVAGVAAYFIDNWQLVLNGIRDGSVHLGPLIEAFGHLWAKLIAVGEVMMGTAGITNATDKVNTILAMFTEGMYWLMGAFSLSLRVAGVLAGVWNSLTSGLTLIAMGFVGLNHVLLKTVDFLLSIPGMSKIMPGSTAWSKANLAASEAALKSMKESIKQDSRDTFKWFDAADAFDDAADYGKNFAKTLQDRIARTLDKESTGAGSGNSTTEPPKITIHNVQVYQDLRNHDPDRIMGAFIRKLEKVAALPTSAVTHEDYGV